MIKKIGFLILVLAVCCVMEGVNFVEAGQIGVYQGKYKEYLEFNTRGSDTRLDLSISPIGYGKRIYQILMRDEKNRYIWEGQWNGEPLFLGKNHKTYKIYIKSMGRTFKEKTSTGLANANKAVGKSGNGWF